MSARPVYFTLCPQFLLLDLAGVAEVFRCASELGGPRFALHFVGPRAKVQSSVGAPLSIRPLPPRLPADAVVAVIGTRTQGKDLRAENELAGWLRDQVRPQHWLVCICSGALLAARAGLLDGRECTTHHELCAALARERPQARVLENRIFVRDGNVFTSAGVTAGIDLALHVVGELAGPVLAAEVARTLVVYLRREGSDPQLSPWLAHRNHLHPQVHRVQEAVTREPQRGWTLQAMAQVAQVSTRQLTRLFRLHAGLSPAAYVAGIRSARALELLRATDLPIERVAEQSGFGSARQFRRTFQARVGFAPSDARVKASA